MEKCAVLIGKKCLFLLTLAANRALGELIKDLNSNETNHQNFAIALN
jgi:hypothetical protein